MLYKDPLLETYKVYFEVPQNFIIQSNEFRQMGRSGICINVNAMEQMWINTVAINVAK